VRKKRWNEAGNNYNGDTAEFIDLQLKVWLLHFLNYRREIKITGY
jgi:hypothetical protein